MTISDLKRSLDEYLSKATVTNGSAGIHINLSRQDFTTAKYACTTEEKDFTFCKGKVFYHGIELISAPV